MARERAFRQRGSRLPHPRLDAALGRGLRAETPLADDAHLTASAYVLRTRRRSPRNAKRRPVDANSSERGLTGIE